MFSKLGVDFWYKIIASKVYVKNLRFFYFSSGTSMEFRRSKLSSFYSALLWLIRVSQFVPYFFSEILNYHCFLKWIIANMSSLKLSICKPNFCCKKLIFKIFDYISYFKIKFYQLYCTKPLILAFFTEDEYGIFQLLWNT